MAYNPNKRKRSWYFDNNVPTESRTYIDGNGQTVTKQVKTRLAKGHLPKEETFQDLIYTTFLKSADGDLQDVASTTEILSATDIEKVVKPNQLPELTNSEAEVIGNFNGAVFEASPKSLSVKRGWFYNFTTAFKNWLLTRLIPSGGTTGQVLKKISNTDYNFSWQNDDTGTGLPAYVQPADDNKILRIDAIDGAKWKTPDFAAQSDLTALQTEVNTIETGAGLNTDGTYTPDGTTTYISTATSLKDADKKLDTAIATKQDTIVAGTTQQYWRGDKTWQNFRADVVATPITLTLVNTDVVNGDTIQDSIGKLQGQIDNLSLSVNINPTQYTISCNTGNFTGTIKYTVLGDRVFFYGELTSVGGASIFRTGLNTFTDIYPAGIRYLPVTILSGGTYNGGVLQLDTVGNNINIQGTLLGGESIFLSGTYHKLN